MKFKSITMENFMRYKGVNTIEFSCDPGKNVTVVLGDNTVGKTTIAQAFRFGLYGAVNMEKWKNADDYQLLNNDVLAFMDADSKAAVSVWTRYGSQIRNCLLFWRPAMTRTTMNKRLCAGAQRCAWTK